MAANSEIAEVKCVVWIMIVSPDGGMVRGYATSGMPGWSAGRGPGAGVPAVLGQPHFRGNCIESKRRNDDRRWLRSPQVNGHDRLQNERGSSDDHSPTGLASCTDAILPIVLLQRPEEMWGTFPTCPGKTGTLETCPTSSWENRGQRVRERVDFAFQRVEMVADADERAIRSLDDWYFNSPFP